MKSPQRHKNIDISKEELERYKGLTAEAREREVSSPVRPFQAAPRKSGALQLMAYIGVVIIAAAAFILLVPAEVRHIEANNPTSSIDDPGSLTSQSEENVRDEEVAPAAFKEVRNAGSPPNKYEMESLDPGVIAAALHECDFEGDAGLFLNLDFPEKKRTPGHLVKVRQRNQSVAECLFDWVNLSVLCCTSGAHSHAQRGFSRRGHGALGVRATPAILLSRAAASSSLTFISFFSRTRPQFNELCESQAHSFADDFGPIDCLEDMLLQVVRATLIPSFGLVLDLAPVPQLIFCPVRSGQIMDT